MKDRYHFYFCRTHTAKTFIFIVQLLFWLLVLTSCNPDSSNESASLVVSVSKQAQRLSTGAKTQAAYKEATDNLIPANITRIDISIFDEADNELDKVDILQTGGSITFTVPTGVTLKVIGSAYAEEELLYSGESSVEPLTAGGVATIALKLLPVGPLTSDIIDRPIQVDVTAADLSGDGMSGSAVFTQQNRSVLFHSSATNLIDNDMNQAFDIFVKNLVSGEITNVHTNSNNELGDGPTQSADASADGRYVVFSSDASNLLLQGEDTNGVRDVFLKDTETGETVRLSVTASGSQVLNNSDTPFISDDGRYVILHSDASLTEDGNTGIFLLDRGTEGTIAINHVGVGSNHQISGDGSKIAYWTEPDNNLIFYDVANKENQATSLFAAASSSAINLDGQFVAFATTENLDTENDPNDSSDVYLFDLAGNTIQLLSTDRHAQSLPEEADGATAPSITDDGRFVSFQYGTTIYIKDAISGEIATTQQFGVFPHISPDGELVAYTGADDNHLYVEPNPLQLLQTSSDDPPTPPQAQPAPGGGNPDGNQFTVTILKTGDGTGSVTSEDQGINCGTDCSQDYTSGTVVTLTAKANDASSSFTGWSGDCTGSESSIAITVDAAKNCTATFALSSATLTVVIKGGPGGGEVNSNDGPPPSMQCVNSDTAETTCSVSYDTGTSLTLIPTPYGNNNTVSWIGCSTDLGLEGCEITVDTDKTVEATFGASSFLFSVSKDGNGTITSTDQAINCGDTCSHSYINGTEVTLQAMEDQDSTFAGWTGDCSASTADPAKTNPITVDAAKSCSASFQLKSYTLTVDPTGSGTGTVTSDSGGIDCGNTCSGTYNQGTVVTLTAKANGNSDFTGWGGACSGAATTAQVTMDAAKSCTANFQLKSYALTIRPVGDGAGTVTSVPAGIDCGNTCSGTYNHGTEVTLTAATADQNSFFAGWGGDCSGTAATAKVTMDAAKTCTANFLAIYVLSVDPIGNGTITSIPAGIDCGSDCSEPYNSGTTVTLTASSTDTTVVRFTGWGGDCSGTTASVDVTMDAAKTCTATFTAVFNLDIIPTGNGSGTITSDPSGIDCGTDCSELYVDGTVVTLTVTPDPDSEFAGIDGDCVQTNLGPQVTMDAAKTCYVSFSLKPVTLSVSDPGNDATITSTPAGINCPGTCSQIFKPGEVVSLKAVENTGVAVAITGWTGDCTGNASTTQVTMDSDKTCSATFTQPPSPTLSFLGTEAGQNGAIIYNLSVDNWAEYPTSMLEPAPDLAACGLNTNSARTWVNIYNAADSSYVYGFCALGTPNDLTKLWFSVAAGTTGPVSVYIELDDRRTGTIYRSNSVVVQPLI